MVVTPVNSFLEQLRESQLLAAAQLDQINQWPQSQEEDPRGLARELLQRRWLTAYQVNQLHLGKSKDLVIGPYHLLERLGEGGMVFKARHQAMQRLVALKVIRPEKLENPSAVRRFYHEIKAMSQLVHPNIVAAYDAGQVGEAHFFAMEFVDGIDLEKLVRQSGPLPVMQAIDYTLQAARGLRHAHEQGLVHRDIKPANLIVTRPAPSSVPNTSASSSKIIARAVVKILDLGLALLDDPWEKQMTLTRLGTVVGSPAYMSPEQVISSHTVDIRSDIFSLGCTFYYLLTGQVAFGGESEPEEMLKNRTWEPAPVERFRSDVPVEVLAVLRKMMARKAADRYQAPDAAIEALKAFCRRKSSTAIPRPVVVPSVAQPTSMKKEKTALDAVPKDAPKTPAEQRANTAPAVARTPQLSNSKQIRRQLVMTSAFSVMIFLSALFLILPFLPKTKGSARTVNGHASPATRSEARP